MKVGSLAGAAMAKHADAAMRLQGDARHNARLSERIARRLGSPIVAWRCPPAAKAAATRRLQSRPMATLLSIASRHLRSVLCAWCVAVSMAAPAVAQDPPPVLLVVGDSASSGYGLAAGQVWVDLLARKLSAEGYRYRVVNGSISGDTTAGGRARLPALLTQHKPAIVVIELGGNDALRGSKLTTTRDNLDAMVTAAQAAGARVLLVGMEMPSNYGPAYVREFRELFVDVARARRVPLVPMFFAGFGEDLSQFQSDRIHPTAAAQPRLLDNVWPQLAPLLRKK
ncbi:MAG: arylesterase [Betaproteobacteria bacterium]